MNEVRASMVNGALQLLAQKGLQGASFAEVLDLTGAPRGSIYHHFPDGKNELVAAALDAVAEATMARFTEFRPAAVAITEGFLGLWSDLLDRAHLSAGCAVVAVSVAGSDDLLDQAGDVFRRWTAGLADRLTVAGLEPDAATEFATLLIATTEGAVIMSRAQRSREPFDRVAALLTSEARRRARGRRRVS